MEDPLLSILTPAHPAQPGEVLAALGAVAARPLDPRPGPPWLRPEQRTTWRQLLPILERFHCALLADPVGSGKTWIALAVAQSWNPGEKTTIIVPAAIAPQWERTAALLEVDAVVWSYERLSRGHLPTSLQHPPGRKRTLVIVDESHHLRIPTTRRYFTLAPALMGRTLLMLSATPVVNRLTDLAVQLLLGLPDDGLRVFGIPSLADHLAESGRASNAVGEVVLASGSTVPGKPARAERKELFSADDPEIDALIGGVERLELSESGAVAGLVRSVFWRALASSPSALLTALTRYRSLLLQARDARAGGKALDRAALRRLTDGDLDQLVMWELLPVESSGGDLILQDLRPLEELLSMARVVSAHPDRKAIRLATLLADKTPTLVFVGARETVRHLRQHLGIPLVAWCTGSAAGIDASRMPRESVLSWFRPDCVHGGGPKVLLTTDVAAEGLDLQAAGRVVHYDLPWTAVRMDQRDGRALRLGARHPLIEIVRMDPYPPLEQRLAQLGILARKRRLPRRAGLDSYGARIWHWRSRIANRYSPDGLSVPSSGSGRGPWCSLRAPFRGAIAGFELFSVIGGDKWRRVAGIIGCLDEEGIWSEDAERIEQWMALARTAPAAGEDDSLGRTRMIEALVEVVRARLDRGRHDRWLPSSHQLLTTQLIGRLNQLATAAARARNRRRLEEIEHGLTFATRGHTAGEMMWLDTLLRLTDSQLLQRLGNVPQSNARSEVMCPRLGGLIVFQC